MSNHRIKTTSFTTYRKMMAKRTQTHKIILVTPRNPSSNRSRLITADGTSDTPLLNKLQIKTTIILINNLHRNNQTRKITSITNNNSSSSEPNNSSRQWKKTKCTNVSPTCSSTFTTVKDTKNIATTTQMSSLFSKTNSNVAIRLQIQTIMKKFKTCKLCLRTRLRV